MLGFVSFLRSFLDEEFKQSDHLKNLSRHFDKYVRPFIGQPNKLRLIKSFKHEGGTISAGDDSNPTHVTPKGMKVINDRVHVTADVGGKEVHIPITHFYKSPELKGKAKTAGFDLETRLHQHLQKHGLTRADRKPAGASKTERDVTIDHPKTGEVIKGKEVDTAQEPKAIAGEVKVGADRAKFASVSFNYNHGTKKWEIPETTRQKKPRVVHEIENATITHNGVKKNFLQHLNDTLGHPHEGHTVKTTNSNEHNLGDVVNGYMHDSGTHFIHIGDKGTYKGGLSQHKDVHNMGLPSISGSGFFQMSTERKRTPQQERKGTGLQINFRARGNTIPKSSEDISTDEGAQKIKSRLLGHKEG